MTSLEFTQAQGLGYARGMYRVPLSIPTYDSVIKVHGMVLASSPGHFHPPTCMAQERMIQQHVHYISRIGMCALCVAIQVAFMHYLTVSGVKKMQGWGSANTLTFAFVHHPYLVCILFGLPSLHLSTFLMFFIYLFPYFFGVNLSYSQFQVYE